MAAGGPEERSTLRLIPAAGGPARALLDPNTIARKPRWHPDGRLLYFLQHEEFDNVWALPFDSEGGTPVGRPFPVTAFQSMIRHIFGTPGLSDFAVSKERLVVPMEDYSNTSIWMLDNVDQ